MTSLDFFFILSTIITIVLYTQNYFNHQNLKYLILIFTILWYMYLNIKYNVVFCLDEETDKKSKIYNYYNSLSNYPGLGIAVSGGMGAISKLCKATPLPLPLKMGIIAAGGIQGGMIYSGGSYILNNVNKSLENKFKSKSILEDNESLSGSYQELINFLEANFILHLCMLYMIITIGIMLFAFYVFNTNYDTTKIENLLGKNLFNWIIKVLEMYAKINKFWLIMVWISLLLGIITSTGYSYFLYHHLESIHQVTINIK